MSGRISSRSRGFQWKSRWILDKRAKFTRSVIFLVNKKTSTRRQQFVLLSNTLTSMVKSRCTFGIAEVGTKMHEKNLAEEMMELRKLWTAVMMEKCRSKNEAVACPKPRRWHVRQSAADNDINLAADLSDILIGKASPPSYAGSPPIRTSNPLIQDAHFCEQR